MPNISWVRGILVVVIVVLDLRRYMGTRYLAPESDDVACNKRALVLAIQAFVEVYAY